MNPLQSWYLAPSLIDLKFFFFFFSKFRKELSLMGMIQINQAQDIDVKKKISPKT